MASPNCRNFNKFLDFRNRYIHILLDKYDKLRNEKKVVFSLQQLCLSKMLLTKPKINRIKLYKDRI